MWGICLGRGAIQAGLFQKVIQYRLDENEKAVIILPESAFKPDVKDIRELSISPQYVYGDRVSPCNHPDMIGVICSI